MCAMKAAIYSETNRMFNLKAKRDGTRSPSPQIRASETSSLPLLTTAKTIAAVGGSTATTSMFNLNKKNEHVDATHTHGYIPGVRSRQVEPVHITDGGRGRSASRDSRKLPQLESKTHATAVTHHAEINAEDIFKAIPTSSSKLPLSEIKRLLAGYVALPKSYWSTELADASATHLVYRQHIRYTRLKDNMFVRGGFIIGFGKQRGRATLTLANGFDQKKRGYYIWVIGLDSIGTLFVKRDSLETKPAIESETI